MNLFDDRTIFQSEPWMRFIAQTQKAKHVVAEIEKHGRTVGYFTGMIVEKFGLRILGSPMRGWTTDYMGLNLLPGICRSEVLSALDQFAFKQLGCVHYEIMDRWISPGAADQLGLKYSIYNTYEIDLRPKQEVLLKNMNENARRYIRRAEKDGSVIIEEAHDAGFAEDYYAQLQDVFAKQNLKPRYGIERVQALIDHLKPSGMLLLLRARDRNGTCMATGIFPAMRDSMYFWGGASLRQHQSMHPNEPLQWYAMRYWKDRGIETYDMGGGGTYKEKYGGKLVTRPWLRKSRYSLV